LFKLGLAILKANETLLLDAHGDELYLPMLRDYFKSLSKPVVSAPFDQIVLGARLPSDKSPMPTQVTGSMLTQHLFSLAFSFQSLTLDKIERCRTASRLTVVQKMEDNSRKSQVRSLSENSAFSQRELGVIYDDFKKVRF
jgi:hypothetical protein